MHIFKVLSIILCFSLFSLAGCIKNSVYVDTTNKISGTLEDLQSPYKEDYDLALKIYVHCIEDNMVLNDNFTLPIIDLAIQAEKGTCHAYNDLMKEILITASLNNNEYHFNDLIIVSAGEEYQQAKKTAIRLALSEMEQERNKYYKDYSLRFYDNNKEMKEFKNLFKYIKD